MSVSNGLFTRFKNGCASGNLDVYIYALSLSLSKKTTTQELLEADFFVFFLGVAHSLENSTIGAVGELLFSSVFGVTIERCKVCTTEYIFLLVIACMAWHRRRRDYNTGTRIETCWYVPCSESIF